MKSLTKAQYITMVVNMVITQNNKLITGILKTLWTEYSGIKFPLCKKWELYDHLEEALTDFLKGKEIGSFKSIVFIKAQLKAISTIRIYCGQWNGSLSEKYHMEQAHKAAKAVKCCSCNFLKCALENEGFDKEEITQFKQALVCLLSKQAPRRYSWGI